MVFEEWASKGLLEMNEESNCRFTMVVIIGRIVAETCFRRIVGMGSRSQYLLGEACTI